MRRVCLHVGEPTANGKSCRLRVEPFGINIAAAPGVSGDHARTSHGTVFTKAAQYTSKKLEFPQVTGDLASFKGSSAKISTRVALPPRTKTHSTASFPTQKSTAAKPCGSPIAHSIKVHSVVTLVEVSFPHESFECPVPTWRDGAQCALSSLPIQMYSPQFLLYIPFPG